MESLLFKIKYIIDYIYFWDGRQLRFQIKLGQRGGGTMEQIGAPTLHKWYFFARCSAHDLWEKLETNIKRCRNQEYFSSQITCTEILPQNLKNRKGTQEKPQKRDLFTLGCRERVNLSSVGVIHHSRDAQSNPALSEEGTTKSWGGEGRPCDLPRVKVAD